MSGKKAVIKTKREYIQDRLCKLKPIPNPNDVRPNTLYKLLANYNAKAEANEILSAVKKGVWQEYLNRKFIKNNVNYFEQIECGTRKNNIFRTKHRGNITLNKIELAEKRQCYQYLVELKVIDGIKLLDREIPLKKSSDDKGFGNIDLIGTKDDALVIIEDKKPLTHNGIKSNKQNTEPLLRAVAEVVTYYHQIGGNKPENNTYINNFNKTYNTNVKRIAIAIMIPKVEYLYGHSLAYKLIDKYNISCYTFKDNNYMDIVRLSDEELAECREISKAHMSFIEEEENSKFIFDSLESKNENNQ